MLTADAYTQETPKASADAETPETTTTMGLKFLDSLKQAKDKTRVPRTSHHSHDTVTDP